MANLPMAGPGKFEGGLALNVYVHALSLEGWLDDAVGSVVEIGHWYGLIRGAPIDEKNNERAFYTLNNDEKEFLRKQAGCIIHEDDQGFVDIEYFEDEEELERRWQEIVVEVESEYPDED